MKTNQFPEERPITDPRMFAAITELEDLVTCGASFLASDFMVKGTTENRPKSTHKRQLGYNRENTNTVELIYPFPLSEIGCAVHDAVAMFCVHAVLQ